MKSIKIEKNIPIPLSCVLCDVAIQPQQFLNGNVWELGYNAQPLADGRCCESCNERVIHTRIVSFDIGQVHFEKYGEGVRKIENDGLEHQIEGGLTLHIGYEMQENNSCRLTANIK